MAYHWIGEPGDTLTLTYRDLYTRVCRFANALVGLGVKKGDRVAIYMGMIPELPVAMLACARIGAVHSVVFGGFSSESLADRILDADARVVITQDGSWRGGNVVPLKHNTDESLERCPDVASVVVVKRTDTPVTMVEGRDHWWHEITKGQPDEMAPARLEAEHPLYILYTSGTTGRPKGIVHTQGGYLTSVMTTHSYVFDLKPDDDTYWCAADIGWVTGHSYIVYGPLANRATSVMYEGAPNHPDLDRLWSIVAEYGVTIFYTAPTAIRSFMKWGDEFPARHDLSLAPAAGNGGRTHQPRGMDVVSRTHRRRELSHRRHLVADRDRFHHDHSLAGGCNHQTRFRHLPLPGHLRRRGGRRRQLGPLGPGRLPGDHPTLAIHGAHHLRRSGALHRHLLVPVSGPLLPRRRMQA